MRRSPIKRRARTKHQARNVEHREYLAWIHTQPCAACGYRGEAIQAAHVGRGGMGKKHGSDAEVIPLCGPKSYGQQACGLVTREGCHADHDQYKGRFAIVVDGVVTSNRSVIRAWDAHQVAVHRGRFEARGEHRREVPF